MNILIAVMAIVSLIIAPPVVSLNNLKKTSFEVFLGYLGLTIYCSLNTPLLLLLSLLTPAHVDEFQ